MTTGILIYKSYNNNFNIGDYIQSLAACQFIDDTVVYINRERLDEYAGSTIKLIMNGWFLHELKHWPPSNNIEPLIISFHLNSDAYDILNNEVSIKYFKKHQPIGCRDKTTMNLLLEKGVHAYFSGCLTLLLGERYKSKEKSNSIYFVDPYFEFDKDILSLVKYTFILISNYGKIKKICKSMFNNLSFKSMMKTASFYKIYINIFDSNVLETAIYIKHVINDKDFTSETAKFDFAKALLFKYATAKFIVTSRIHCALPCLDLETPVLYVENINQPLTSYCRLNGLRELLHVINYDNGKMELTSSNLGTMKITADYLFSNKQEYLMIKEKLIHNCSNFFNS